MNGAPAELPADLASPKPRGGVRWFAAIAFVFTTQVALIFLLGEKKEPDPREVLGAPTWALVENSDELLALNDPTLFALPQPRDFASVAWLKPRDVNSPPFHYTEPPQPLTSPAADSLGAAFGRFMQTNFFATIQPPDFKPVAELNTPTLPIEIAPAQNSTMKIEGELAQRQLPASIILTNWPYADVIAPSKVQVLVDAAGNVVSAVLLPPDNGLTVADYYALADQRALEIARALRFAPSAQSVLGRIIFNWQTVPPIASP
jgi:hypothetical protein